MEVTDSSPAPVAVSAKECVGRGVAVDGDAVEAGVGGLAHPVAKQFRQDCRIGSDEAQHGRHVATDHPRPLASR
jgi:hypothetical protein